MDMNIIIIRVKKGILITQKLKIWMVINKYSTFEYSKNYQIK